MELPNAFHHDGVAMPIMSIIAPHTSPARRGRTAGIAATAVAALVVGAGAFAATGAPAGATTPEWRTLTATSADAFVDSVGVNVHTNYTDTVYADQERTLRLAKGLGIRHVRDGLKARHPAMHAALRRMRDAGIRASLIAEPSGRYGAGTLAEQIAALKDPNRLAGVADAIEGPNELDCGGWNDAVRGQQASLAQALEAEPTLRDLPLLGPSWCRGMSSVRRYGNDGANSDAWNLHPYPGGHMPEAEVGGQLDPDWGIAGQYAGARALENQPVWATETGYHNAVAGNGDGHNPTSEKASGPYAARLALEYARVGVKRHYFYELQNEHSETALVDREQHFGLVRHDGSLKPSYLSLQTLLRTLADPGPKVADRQVRLGLEGAPADLRTMAFARRNGSVDVVLWRAASLWDVRAKRDLTVPVADVRLSTEKATTATLTPVPGTPRILGSGTAFSVPVGGAPVIVRLGAAGGSPTATPPTPTGTVTTGAGYDLVVTGVTMYPRTRTAGQRLYFIATVKNVGTRATPSGVIHGVRFDLDGRFVAFADRHTAALAPGASVRVRANGAPRGGQVSWIATAGRHTLRAHVDDVNRLPRELNENNNTRTKTLTIR